MRRPALPFETVHDTWHLSRMLVWPLLIGRQNEPGGGPRLCGRLDRHSDAPCRSEDGIEDTLVDQIFRTGQIAVVCRQSADIRILGAMGSSSCFYSFDHICVVW